MKEITNYLVAAVGQVAVALCTVCEQRTLKPQRAMLGRDGEVITDGCGDCPPTLEDDAPTLEDDAPTLEDDGHTLDPDAHTLDPDALDLTHTNDGGVFVALSGSYVTSSGASGQAWCSRYTVDT